MAVDILRANYDAPSILITEAAGIPVQLPTFGDRYTLYGFPQINSTNPPETGFPLVNDFTLVNHVNRFGQPFSTLSQFPIYSGGNEWRTRQYLAQLGFKPDANYYRKGFPLVPSSMSRVADLEPVNSARNGYVHTNPLLTTHVVPYTYASFVAAGTTVDIAVAGYGGAGIFAPFPYPRILTAWRVFDVTNARRHAPRGSKSASNTPSGPDWVGISNDGTLKVSSFIDSARFGNAGTHGSIIGLVPGNSYEIQIGHSEPGPPSGRANQRWNSAALGNQDWVTGSPIPP